MNTNPSKKLIESQIWRKKDCSIVVLAVAKEKLSYSDLRKKDQY